MHELTCSYRPVGRTAGVRLAAVIDRHDREVIDYTLALRSQAKEAAR
ncbi:MAG: hypothetical protein OJF51_004004 [Nitrospira sp.]|nr:MAG: hypothetical protein OJF51_004004 [Nitrospira sp.]